MNNIVGWCVSHGKQRFIKMNTVFSLLNSTCSSDNIIQMSLLNSLGTRSEVEEDGMFEPVLEQGLEYQISFVENTVKTDAKGREGGGLIATS